MTGATWVLLIGGTSHAGKSTLARALGRRLGWSVQSTDALARHPGRPWRAAPEMAPPHVVEHFGTLTVDALMRDVCTHYESIWPTLVEPLIQASLASRTASGLVLEGSALLPAKVAALDGAIGAAWITAPEATLRARILAESGFERMPRAGRAVVDAFVARTLAFDALIRSEVARLSLPVVELRTGLTERELEDRFLAAAHFDPEPRASR